MQQLISLNPHDQSEIGSVTIASAERVKQAVQSAQAALGSWRQVSLAERIYIIAKYRELLAADRISLAELVTTEMGKPLDQSMSDIDSELEFLDWFIAHAAEAFGPQRLATPGGARYEKFYEPWGVCAVISPWNFPYSMANSGIVPALLAGNTVIFKPSEQTPISQGRVVELLQKAGIPIGVLQLVHGRSDVGAELVSHDPDMVWFTGSTKTGREIYKTCGDRLIKMVGEFGGSSPAIVFADCDLRRTVEAVFWGRFLNNGQVCSAIKRLFVDETIYEQFVSLLAERIKHTTLGDPMNPHEFGPLVSAQQLATTEAQVADALAKGAKVIVGGSRPTDDAVAKGNYYLPTLLTDVSKDMLVMSEEVFGPVLPVLPFKTVEQAIQLANDTSYGLSAEIFTSNIQLGQNIAAQMQAGQIGINTSQYYVPFMPFGGYKQSGIGREFGIEGLREFSQIKVVATQA